MVVPKSRTAIVAGASCAPLSPAGERAPAASTGSRRRWTAGTAPGSAATRSPSCWATMRVRRITSTAIAFGRSSKTLEIGNDHGCGNCDPLCSGGLAPRSGRVTAVDAKTDMKDSPGLDDQRARKRRTDGSRYGTCAGKRIRMIAYTHYRKANPQPLVSKFFYLSYRYRTPSPFFGGPAHTNKITR